MLSPNHRKTELSQQHNNTSNKDEQKIYLTGSKPADKPVPDFKVSPIDQDGNNVKSEMTAKQTSVVAGISTIIMGIRKKKN